MFGFQPSRVNMLFMHFVRFCNMRHFLVRHLSFNLASLPLCCSCTDSQIQRPNLDNRETLSCLKKKIDFRIDNESLSPVKTKFVGEKNSGILRNCSTCLRVSEGFSTNSSPSIIIICFCKYEVTMYIRQIQLTTNF